jgi:predicted AAA+ superfamily ATPase
VKAKKYISRVNYVNRIKPFVKKDIIKVITGQRRVGKSFLVYELMDFVKKSDKDASIIYINKELDEFSNISNHKQLLDYVKSKKVKGKFCYLFIDEIQDIKDFEKALRSLTAEGGFDLYITGSNANLLSGELATYLSGRYIEIKVYSLSYQEFLIFHKLSNSSETFLSYLKYGGLPYLIHIPFEDYIIYDYLKNIYNTIILKDVVARYNIRNVGFLERLLKFICDNTGHIVSAKKISDFLKSQKILISTQVVLNYLNYLTNSMLVYKIERSDIQGKKIFEIGEKYYFEDLGIRNSVIGFKITDFDSILENVVFLHLIISGFKVTVGTRGGKEIDFVAEKSGEKIYVQVCYLLSSKDVIDREFGNLLLVSDNFPKYVVSYDDAGVTNSHEGIKHLNVREFCLLKF